MRQVLVVLAILAVLNARVQEGHGHDGAVHLLVAIQVNEEEASGVRVRIVSALLAGVDVPGKYRVK